MVIIRFQDAETERKALGKIIGRFSFKTWETGLTMVPEPALVFLASEGFSFSVEGPADYAHIASLRALAPSPIQ